MADLVKFFRDRKKDLGEAVDVVSRGTSRVFDQVNPLDNNRTYQQRTPTNRQSVVQQATNNGLAKATVQPLIRFPINLANASANLAHRASGNPQLIRTPRQQFSDPFTSNLRNYTGATGSNRQLIGDAVNIGTTAFLPGTSKALEQGIARLAPQVPTLAAKVASNAVVGAPTGAVANVATTISEDKTPLTRQNVSRAALQGAAFGAGGGAALPLAGAATRATVPVVKTAATQTARVAQQANERAFTPRVNLEDQNALRAMSDYLSGTSQEGGADLSKTIANARTAAQRYGVDINSGSQADRLSAVNSILDQVGQRNKQVAQGGYLKIPNGDEPSINSPGYVRAAQRQALINAGVSRKTLNDTPIDRLLPDTEERIFAQNPMLPENQPKLVGSDTGAPQPKLPEFNTKKVSNIDKALRSTRSIIERQGPSGQKLAGMLQGSRDTQEIYLANLQKSLPTVRRLKGKAYENFVDATQGLAKPVNNLVAKAVQEWRAVHPTIRQRATEAGLDVGDLGETYYPHFVDYDRLFKDKNAYNAAINHLVDTGQARSPEEAIQLLGFARDVSRNREFGNLEASRLIDIPFYDKTPNSLISYLNGSAKRIAQTETFGKGDENALNLIKQIGVEGGDTEAAKNAYDVAVGAKRYNPTTEKVSKNIRRYVTTTRLGLGALTNVSQNVNTGIVTGHMRTLLSGFKQLDPKTRAFVEDTGVIADAVLNDIRTQSGFASFGQRAAGKVADKITAPFFGTVEKLNRSIAATAGRDYGLRLAQKGDEKTLRKLGVTGDINGTLTPAQQIQVARKVVEKTQFKVDPQDLPGWTDTPGGKLVAQFRTFSYNQGKFFSNEILKPAAKGNLMPLARLMAALPLGYALYETKRAIAGRPEEENSTKRGLQAFQNVGGAGLVFDLYQSLNPIGSKYLPPDRRTSMAIGAFGGPAIGVGAQGVGAASEAIQRKNTPTDPSRLEGKVVAGKNENDYTDLTSLARFGLQQVPIVGTAIKNRVLPFNTESNADAGKTGNSSVDKAVEAANKAEADYKKSLAKELTPEENTIRKLSKADKQKLVDQGAITQEQIDTIDSKLNNIDSKLGRGKSKTDDLYKSPDAEYKTALKKYQQDKKEGKITQIKDIERQRTLEKLKVGSDYDKNVRDLYSLSKANVYKFITSDPNGKKYAEQLKAYDDALYNAGLTSYRKFTDKNGKESFAPKTSKGGGRKGSGKAKKTNITALTKALGAPKVARIKAPTIKAKKTKAPKFKVPKVATPKTKTNGALNKLLGARTKTA